MLPVPQNAAADAPTQTDSTEHQAKRVRYSAEPDLEVLVGAAEKQKTFHVHATILIQNSKYFRDMLTSEHFAKNVVDVSDEDPAHFELFYNALSVVSSGPLSTEQAFAVGAFANKYDVAQLKDKMDKQVALAPPNGHPPSGPSSLDFALTHNLHLRAARCVETMPLEAKFMPQLMLLTEQDHSEHGKQALLLTALWPRLRTAAKLSSFGMPAPPHAKDAETIRRQLRCMWPFLTARIAPAPDGTPMHELEYVKKAQWLAELEPAKWLGDEADNDRKSAYAQLIKHLWPELCKEAAVKLPMPNLRHIQSMWPFVSRAVLSASYPDKFKMLVTDARTITARVNSKLLLELHPERQAKLSDSVGKESKKGRQLRWTVRPRRRGERRRAT